ncbi:monocarboxylate transporter 14-like [Tubulanus polymorphus]|uniref:monocarboxylate transporter 14-like n=1 Tax=Tubulanus polymorphus TaxID=672921 RepID=UPI003DA51788
MTKESNAEMEPVELDIFSPKDSDPQLAEPIPNGDAKTNGDLVAAGDRDEPAKKKDAKPDWLIARENDPDIDGGWGWVVVFGSFMIHVIADGIAYAFGIIILELTRYFGTGKGETSWVASLMIGITFASGPIASTFTNVYGCRVTTIIGAIVTSIGFILSIFAPNLYFLYFSFGILGGLGLGLIYLPAIVSVGQYFEKKRSFATGLAVCGSGVGTFAFAPLIQKLVDEYSWKGATLIMAGLALNCMCFGALFRPIQIPSAAKPTTTATAENGDNSEKRQLLGSRAVDNEVLFEKLRRAAAQSKQRQNDDVRINDKMITSCPEVNQIRRRSATRNVFSSGPIASGADFSRSQQELKQEIFNTYKSNHMLHFVSLTNIPGADENKDKQGCKGALSEAFNQLTDFALLSNVVFMLFAVSNFCTSIGFNAPYIYLPDMARIKGIEKEKASFLISVIGIGNTFGRVFFGYISDIPKVRAWQSGKLGRLTIYSAALTLCGVATCLSPWSTNYSLLVAYAASYGILVGTYVTLTAVVLVDLIGLDRLTSSFGLLLLFQGIATFIGPPIAGWLYDGTGSYDFSFYIIGFMIAISGAMLFVYFAPCIKNTIIPAADGESADCERGADKSDKLADNGLTTPCNTPEEIEIATS